MQYKFGIFLYQRYISRTYKPTAINNCGSFLDDIVVNTGVCNVEMPTAFTPNNDYVNNVFREIPAIIKSENFSSWRPGDIC
jgi:hypothetical protein